MAERTWAVLETPWVGSRSTSIRDTGEHKRLMHTLSLFQDAPKYLEVMAPCHTG